MSKVIVQPKNKPVMLSAPNGEIIDAFRPSVVTNSVFIGQKVALGHIEIVHGQPLKAEAKDEVLAQYIKESTAKSKKAQIKSGLTKFLNEFSVESDDSTETDGATSTETETPEKG